jgi:hypothetical protein
MHLNNKPYHVTWHSNMFLQYGYVTGCTDSSLLHRGRGSSLFEAVKLNKTVSWRQGIVLNVLNTCFKSRKRWMRLTLAFSGVFSAQNKGRNLVQLKATGPSKLNPVECVCGAAQCVQCADVWQHASWHAMRELRMWDADGFSDISV